MELEAKRLFVPDGTDPDTKYHRIFNQAFQDWMSRGDFRERRRRARNYLRGKQWDDLIYDHKEKDYVTEEEYLQRRGRLTTKNNQLEPIMRNLKGQFRENLPSPIVFSRNRDSSSLGDMMTEALRTVHDLNEANELDAHQFVEFMMSGACGERIQYSWWDRLHRSEVTMEPVDQTRLAYNPDVSDIRLRDLSRWMYLHSIDLEDVISTFAKTRKDAKKIRQWYAGEGSEIEWAGLSGKSRSDAVDFYHESDRGKVRVIEVWRKEKKWVSILHDPLTGDSEITDLSEDDVAEMNRHRLDHALAVELATEGLTLEDVEEADLHERRLAMAQTGEIQLYELDERYESIWRSYFFTPRMQVLFETDSPYMHNESVLSLALYPMIDGEVYGLFETLIDQQRYINRMISMLDFLIGSSAKGVLMIDKNLIPKDSSPEQFLQDFHEFDGVIFYESDRNNPANLPKHITANSVPVGMTDMLKMQQELLEKISGVVGAMSGHDPKSGTPASLYMQQTVNASLTNRDLFETFFAWMRKRDRLIVQLIQQYWDDPIFLRSGGKNSNSVTSMRYEPNAVKDVDFDLVMSQGENSAVYRQIVDESLREFLANQFITFEEYLETCNMPYKDTLMEKIRERRSQMQEQGGVLPYDPSMGADPNVNPQS